MGRVSYLVFAVLFSVSSLSLSMCVTLSVSSHGIIIPYISFDSLGDSEVFHVHGVMDLHSWQNQQKKKKIFHFYILREG